MKSLTRLLSQLSPNGVSVHTSYTRATGEELKKELNPGEHRFRNFASLEFDGEAFMTPRDFLDSLIQERPRPRIKSKVIGEGVLLLIVCSEASVINSKPLKSYLKIL